MSRFGLLGRNISYSFSPLLHLSAAAKLNIPCSYELFDLTPEAVSPFIKQFFANGGKGLNITTPYKAYVAELVNSPLSAINTLVQKEEKIIGCSTDGMGFFSAVEHAFSRPLPSFSRIVFLGAGGAVLSLLEHISSCGFNGEISILRRNSKNDELLKKIFPPLILREFSQKEAIASCTGSFAQPDTLLIQATTHSYLKPIFPSLLEHFRGSFFDLNYGEKLTDLYFQAKNLSIPHANGISMLIEQARACQEIWWGKSASYQDIQSALRN